MLTQHRSRWRQRRRQPARVAEYTEIYLLHSNGAASVGYETDSLRGQTTQLDHARDCITTSGLGRG